MSLKNKLNWLERFVFKIQNEIKSINDKKEDKKVELKFIETTQDYFRYTFDIGKVKSCLSFIYSSTLSSWTVHLVLEGISGSDTFTGKVHSNVLYRNSSSLAFKLLFKEISDVNYSSITLIEKSQISSSDIVFPPMTLDLSIYDETNGVVYKLFVYATPSFRKGYLEKIS
jgi:hypothetical protein